MIGQKKTKEIIRDMFNNVKFPNCIIFYGPKGSGKKTLVTEMFKPFIVPEDLKVETIRKLIDMAYKMYDRIFVIPDIDGMSIAGENALLKILEESPNNNKFILTATDLSNVLETIRSRAFTISMDVYSKKELEEYANSKFQISKNDLDLMLRIADVPGDIDLLYTYNVNDFCDYVELVIDNIAYVSGANAFKIADKIALKNEDDKYDLSLFWKAFNAICLIRTEQSLEYLEHYSKGIKITSSVIRELRINGINKQSLFDMWVLNIRENWLSDDTGITE